MAFTTVKLAAEKAKFLKKFGLSSLQQGDLGGLAAQRCHDLGESAGSAVSARADRRASGTLFERAGRSN